MEYLGRAARVPHGDGTWSKFMPIREAEKYEHHLNVQRFLKMLRAGKHVIGLSDDIPAMYAAQNLYKKERESAANTLTQAD
jgi:hypothetical protein